MLRASPKWCGRLRSFLGAPLRRSLWPSPALHRNRPAEPFELPVEEHEERTGLPVIAILGRPNVGKSTLFNCFVRLFSGKYKNSSIVTNIPGTTRDRIYAFLELPDSAELPVGRCMMVDTGGIYSTSERVPSAHDAEGRIDELIQQQALIAMEQANAVIYVTEVSNAIDPVDKRLASWLRRKYRGVLEDRIILVVNKVDNDDRSDMVPAFVRLGLGEPISCSSAHSAGLSEVFYKAMHTMIRHRDQPIAMALEAVQAARLARKENQQLDAPVDASESPENEEGESGEEETYQISWDGLMAGGLRSHSEISNLSHMTTMNTDLAYHRTAVQVEALEQAQSELAATSSDNAPATTERPRTLKLAILGRPNVGKSSILNAIVGKNRAIVSNVAGTTHDPIDEKITWRGTTDILLVDTAGIRRKGHHSLGVESLTILWAMQIIERSEVVLLVVDAKEGISRQDKRLASEVLERNRSVIVVVNKWDGKVKRKNKLIAYEKYVRKELNFLSFVPVVFASAINKENLEPIVDLAILVGQQRRQRIPTHKLMDIVHSMDHKGPGSKKRNMKVKFITQARVQSPTFALFATNCDLCTESYKRYVENCIRARFPFTGTPLRLIITDNPSKRSVTSRPKSRKFKSPLPENAKTK